MTVLNTNFENLLYLTQLNKPEYHEGYIWSEELWNLIYDRIESGQDLFLEKIVLQRSINGLETVTGYNRLLSLIIAYNALLDMDLGIESRDDLFEQRLAYDEKDPKQRDAYDYFKRHFEEGIKYGLSEEKNAEIFKAHIHQIAFKVVILDECDESAEGIYTKATAISR